jgi:PKD repeat protein
MSDRVSSLDPGYQIGDLSIFPHAVDTKDTLYEARNNAETVLQQTLPFNGKYIVVDDARSFPPRGLLRVGPLRGVIDLQKGTHFPSTVPGTQGDAELVYYGERTDTVFKNLIRGFAGSVTGSIQSQWPINTPVSNAVFAEHHNALKDAIYNIETYVGTKLNPTEGSLNQILSQLEKKFLAPKPLFRAYPRSGRPSLSVRFQNFSSGDVLRYFWDFGDHSTSTDANPVHTYQTEGIYTVTLSIITSTGAQGIAVKSNYITVSNDEPVPFMYIQLKDPAQPAYSKETAEALGKEAAVCRFVDQTQGEVVQRVWVFGDGETVSVDDPNSHEIIHTYDTPDIYKPSLVVFFLNESYKRYIADEIQII